MKMRAIISGGGTGGHIFPAIAIANCIKSRYADAEILFVGAEGKMEMQKVPQAGYKIIGLKIAGFQRKKLWKNFSLPFKMLSASIKAKKIIKQFNPDIVIGVGGYASWATLKQASSMGIPTLLQEQNSFAGVSNKKLSKKAKTICVAYDNMESFFDKTKIVKTGNPVRKNIALIQSNIDNLRQEAINTFSLSKGKKTILVIGGSLGARTINNAIENNIDFFIENDIQLLWQTGKYYYEGIISRTKDKIKNTNNIHIQEFIFDMDKAYSVADIIISRAGALSISELCCVGKPTILVPSPNVAEDHQTKNAMALVEKNAAIMVEDSKMNEQIITTLKDLLANSDKQKTLGENILSLSIKNADELIVDEVNKICRK
ncbi:MAG: undecaprenyldiphospho-muramoylpentapeptide beta-N-acetylglucosaminyltransferase [Bacteroidales bacterium]|nr:undecaprenyldiphospho-muramoylpentapeptide beta-N-acetylglucosaminyltransferase [Bacteroidales bacterium]